MSDASAELARQAAWQKERRDLPWPEKVRMVLVMRESVAALRKTWPSSSGSATANAGEAKAPASAK
jgi:hypothetical protein